MKLMTERKSLFSGMWTIPNFVSVLRLLGIPLFLWLLLVARNDVAAFFVLVFAGATDWVDGYLARRLNQQSELGVLLDPLVDRLYILATLIGLLLRDLIPIWMLLIVVGRDLALIVLVPMLRRSGRVALPVTYVGKTGTFALLWGFPILVLQTLPWPWGSVIGAIGWAFVMWGAFLYWWSGIRYAQAAMRLEAQR
jgi:cardiolipin synthase